MTLFDSPDFEGHEGVHAFFDEKTGLKSIIAIHSTARGPAAGGCRMWDYSSADAAVTRRPCACRAAMSYKNAMAELDLGGGKAVIIGDSRSQKTPELFEAFGRAVDSLNGQYWTAEDVGVSPADLEKHPQDHPLRRRPGRPRGPPRAIRRRSPPRACSGACGCASSAP